MSDSLSRFFGPDSDETEPVPDIFPPEVGFVYQLLQKNFINYNKCHFRWKKGISNIKDN